MSARAALAAAAATIVAAACAGDGTETRDRCPGCAPGSLVWSHLARSDNDARVSGVLISPGEPPWFAGSYTQNLTIGGRRIGGADLTPVSDPFAARVDVANAPDPYIGVGLGTPRVSVAGIVSDREEGVVAIVAGVIGEGGNGIVQAVTLDHAQQQVRRVELATLSEPPATGTTAVMAPDPHGWPIVAISGSDIDADGDGTVPGPRAVVMRVGQGWNREPLYTQAGIEILAVAAADAATIVIAGRYTGTPPSWPACTEAWCGFVAALDGSAPGGDTLRWRRVIRATGTAEVRAITASPAGDVIALVEQTGDPVEPTLGGAPASLYLAYLDAAGADRMQQVLATAPVTLGGVRALALTEDGTVIAALALAVTADGALTLAGMPFAAEGEPDTHDVVVAEIDAVDGARWMVPVRGADVLVGSLAVDRAQIALGGWFEGPLSVPTRALFEDTTPIVQGYALELTR